MTPSRTNRAAEKAIADRDIRFDSPGFTSEPRTKTAISPYDLLDKLAAYRVDDLLYRPASAARNLLFHLRNKAYFQQHVRSEGVRTSETPFQASLILMK